MTGCGRFGDARRGNDGCDELFAENDHLREGERIGVRDRQLRRAAADLGEAPRGAAVQPELRRTAGLPDDFDIAPQHALRVAGPERFHRRFLRGETTCEMDGRIPSTHAVGDLRVGEDPVRESVAVTVDRRRNTRNLCCVEP